MVHQAVFTTQLYARLIYNANGAGVSVEWAFPAALRAKRRG